MRKIISVGENDAGDCEVTFAGASPSDVLTDNEALPLNGTLDLRVRLSREELETLARAVLSSLAIPIKVGRARL